jgi:hypothetical protein
MVFGALSGYTDGWAIPYALIFIVCIVFNQKIFKSSAWIVSGLFVAFQLMITAWVGDTGDYTSAFIMLFILILSIFKFIQDRKTPN